MRDFLRHLDWLRAQGAGTAVFTIIPTAKARSFAAEARTLTANGMAEMVEPKRLALMAALLQGQIARTLDDLADMFVRQMQRMHARAKEALAAHQLQQLTHWRSDPTPARRRAGVSRRRTAGAAAGRRRDPAPARRRCHPGTLRGVRHHHRPWPHSVPVPPLPRSPPDVPGRACRKL